MKNLYIFFTACIMLDITSCETKPQENNFPKEQSNKESIANKDNADPFALDNGMITQKIDSKTSRDTCVLLGNHDGKDVFWEQKGYGCQIVIKDDKEEEVIDIDSWLPYAPQGCEVEDGKWVRFLVGVDGHRMSWEDIMYLTKGYAESKIRAYGSPYDVRDMKYLETSFPPSMVRYEESCPVVVKAFIMPQTDEKKLAPHVYKAMSGEKAVASFRPASFYEAFEQYAHDFYSNTGDGDIIGEENHYCIPVWMNEQYGAITYFFYSVEKPAMNYFFDAFYQTTIHGRNTPLGFVDIFNKGAEQHVLKLLNQDMKDFAKYGDSDAVENVDGYHFALTRRGVAVTVVYQDITEVTPFQLLPYQEIKDLLTPEAKKMINI